MYCMYCGAENSEEAKFCQKCGALLAAGQAAGQAAVTVRQTVKNPSKIKSVTIRFFKTIISIISGLIGIFVGCVIAFAFIWAITYVFSAKPWVNRGKGADDPTAVARAYLLCCQYRDTSYIEKYLDETWDNNNIMESLEEYFQEMDAINFGEINMSGVTYDVGEEYERKGYTCVSVTIHFAEKGFFGGNTILGYSGETTLVLHMRNTLNGEKWFMGGK